MFYPVVVADITRVRAQCDDPFIVSFAFTMYLPSESLRNT